MMMAAEQWVTTGQAAEKAGVTSRAIRYWITAGLIPSRRESRADEHRRAKLYVSLPEVEREASRLNTQRFPEGFWPSKPQPPKVAEEDMMSIISDLFDEPEPLAARRQQRDEDIYRLVRDTLATLAEGIRAACADADDWEALPDVAGCVRQVVEADVAAARTQAEQRSRDLADLQHLRQWRQKIKDAVNG